MKKATFTLVLFLACSNFIFSQWQVLNLAKASGGNIPSIINDLISDNNQLYAATNDGIWVSPSQNGGDWAAFGLQGSKVNLLSFGTLKLASVIAVAADDATKTAGKLYKLSAGNWVLTQLNPTSTKNIGSAYMAFTQIQDAQNNTIIFYGTWGSGIWRSADGGDNWTNYAQEAVGSTFAYKNILGMYAVPGDNKVYATDKVSGTESHLDISLDYGQTWTHANIGNFFNPYAFLKRNYGGKSYLYYGGENGNNGFMSYTNTDVIDWIGSFTLGDGGLHNHCMIGNNDGPMYIMSGRGKVYVSTTNGETFSEMSTGIPQLQTTVNFYLTKLALTSTRLYVATNQNGIYYYNLSISGINQISEQGNICYPSVAKNELTVNTALGSKISILTLDGKLMKTVTAHSEKMNLDIRNLAPAMYVLKSQRVDGKTIVDKFIKE